MATISEKNTRRYRVQFSMSRSLYQQYEATMERANKLNVVIDFGRDFEKWFSNQLEQVARELQQMEDEQGQPVSPQSVTTTTGSDSSSITRSATDHITLEGGADHA